MRRMQRLALAVLAAFAATTSASNMCDSDTDFMANKHIDVFLGNTIDRSCQDVNDDILSNLNAES